MIRNTIMKFVNPKILHRVLTREEEANNVCKPFDFIKACIREDEISQETGITVTVPSTFLNTVQTNCWTDEESEEECVDYEINTVPASPVPTTKLPSGQKFYGKPRSPGVMINKPGQARDPRPGIRPRRTESTPYQSPVRRGPQTDKMKNNT